MHTDQICYRPGRVSFGAQRQSFTDILQAIEAARLEGRQLSLSFDDDGLGVGTMIHVPGGLGSVDCGGLVTLRAKTGRGLAYNLTVDAGTTLYEPREIEGDLQVFGGLGGPAFAFNWATSDVFALRNGCGLLLAPGATSPLVVVPGAVGGAPGIFALDIDQDALLDPTLVSGIPLFDLLTDTSGPSPVGALMAVYTQGSVYYNSSALVRGGAATALEILQDGGPTFPVDPTVMLGTVTRLPYAHASTLDYGTGTPASWAGAAPTNAGDALDRLAAQLAAVGGAPVP